MTISQRALSYSSSRQNLPSAPKRTERAERRFKFPVPITVLAFGAGWQLFKDVAVTANVSEHGVCFHLDRELALGSPVALSAVPRSGSNSNRPDVTNPPHVINPPHVVAHIVWTRAASPGWDVGARILGDVSILHLAFPPAPEPED